MKRTLMILALLAAGTGLSATAQETTTNSSATERGLDGTTPRQRDAALTMEGEITRMDEQKNLFWLQMPDGREMQFSFAEDTPIIGSPAATQDLRNKPEKGMNVKVEYDNVGGSNVVTKIQIQPAKS